MSHAEILGPEAEIVSLRAERDHLRRELDRTYAMQKAVEELKAAYEANTQIAKRSIKIREAIMKLIQA
ncbi:MAG TPA: hypothetical protein VJK02_06115 [Anaerolineales bacterium]|nr:hypothetical protein [Anaerolineales bacterium]HLE04629.1 hypothetical protein [Anaerolineales bacterium]